MCGSTRNGNQEVANMFMLVDIGPLLLIPDGFGFLVTGDVMALKVNNGFAVIGEGGKVEDIKK
jgi:hypothetical protein